MRAAGTIAVALIAMFVVAGGAEAHKKKAPDEELGPYAPAFAAAGKSKWGQALRLAKADPTEPLIYKIIEWMALEGARRMPPFERYAAFIRDNPDWPKLDKLRRRAEVVMDTTVSDLEVFAWFAERPPLTGLGSLRLAEAWLRVGARNTGLDLLRDAWINGNFTYREEKVIYRRHRKNLRAEDHVARLDRLIWDRRRRPAQRMFKRVDPDMRALAVARIRLMIRAGDVDSAIARVPDELRDDPGLTYERLRWRRRKGKHKSARELLAELPADMVRPEKWWREAHIETREAMSDGLITEAYRLASRHGQTRALPRAQAEWLAGWIALRFLEDSQLAYPHFTTLYTGVRYPISVSRAAYWAGRAAMKSGNPSRADEWYSRASRYPTTYYGQLALAALGSDGLLPLPRDPGFTGLDVAFVYDHELTSVVRLLAEYGMEKLSRPFILQLGRLARTPGQYRLVAMLAEDSDRPDLAVSLARRVARKNVTLVEHGYPIIQLPAPRGPAKYAEMALVLAMLRQESGFERGIVSHRGARGLMQILPRTARAVARSLKIPYSRKRLTGDADYNLTLGQAYIGGLVRKFGGSYLLAVAAYNAGTGRVSRWMREFGDPRTAEVDVIDWVERIPISETRNYVQRVLEAVPVYRRLLGQEASPDSLATLLHRGTAGSPT